MRLGALVVAARAAGAEPDALSRAVAEGLDRGGLHAGDLQRWDQALDAVSRLVALAPADDGT